MKAWELIECLKMLPDGCNVTINGGDIRVVKSGDNYELESCDTHSYTTTKSSYKEVDRIIRKMRDYYNNHDSFLTHIDLT